MIRVHFIFIMILLFSCKIKKEDDNKIIAINDNEIVIPEFQSIIDSLDLSGSILIYDFLNDKHYSNNFEWARKGKLPASTFKIVNSIIAIETGVVDNDSTLLKWYGEERSIKIWEQDLILKNAFHYSCVPCYQEIARKIGAKQMKDYLKKLNYGNMVVDTTNIDRFWLEGDSRINQFQQINFLKRFHTSDLPITQRTDSIIKKMIIIEENDYYTLRGKTGWSITNEVHNGWFVGYLESQNNVFFFATNLEPLPQFDMNKFPSVRKIATMKALKKMNIIN